MLKKKILKSFSENYILLVLTPNDATINSYCCKIKTEK